MKTTRSVNPFWHSWLIAAAVMLLSAAPLMARTITITDEDCDKAAMFAVKAPRMGWACYETGAGHYFNTSVQLVRNHPFLMRILLDKIPKGYKISKAELIIPIEYTWRAETRFFCWRLLVDWGPGACYLYRTTKPKPIEWAAPGASGGSSDRSSKPTAVPAPKTSGEETINVTQDVELWYSGAAPNNGWVFTMEEDATIRLSCPAYTKGSWKLRVTYEPK